MVFSAHESRSRRKGRPSRPSSRDIQAAAPPARFGSFWGNGFRERVQRVCVSLRPDGHHQGESAAMKKTIGLLLLMTSIVLRIAQHGRGRVVDRVADELGCDAATAHAALVWFRIELHNLRVAGVTEGTTATDDDAVGILVRVLDETLSVVVSLPEAVVEGHTTCVPVLVPPALGQLLLTRPPTAGSRPTAPPTRAIGTHGGRGSDVGIVWHMGSQKRERCPGAPDGIVLSDVAANLSAVSRQMGLGRSRPGATRR